MELKQLYCNCDVYEKLMSANLDLIEENQKLYTALVQISKLTEEHMPLIIEIAEDAIKNDAK